MKKPFDGSSTSTAPGLPPRPLSLIPVTVYALPTVKLAAVACDPKNLTVSPTPNPAKEFGDIVTESACAFGKLSFITLALVKKSMLGTG